jgi:hypothetical protein
MSAPLNIAQASRLVDKSFQRVFEKTSEPEMKLKSYFNYRTTTDYFEKDTGLSGLSEAEFNDENGVVIADVPIQTYAKTYTQNQIDAMVSYTKQMWAFGIKKRDLNNAASELKRAVSRKNERLAAERLDNGFESISYTHAGAAKNTTITTSGGDSLGAFDDDHTREDGGTNMNNYVYDGTTYNLPLDYAGLKAAARTAALFVDPRGNPNAANIDTIVVKKGSANAFKAKEIKGAMAKGRIPESFDNDGSALSDFTLIELDYLTNAGYWYGFDSTRKGDTYGFQFVESQGTTLMPQNVVYKTAEIQFKVESMSDMGHNDTARMWVASKGTSANPDN